MDSSKRILALDLSFGDNYLSIVSHKIGTHDNRCIHDIYDTKSLNPTKNQNFFDSLKQVKEIENRITYVKFGFEENIIFVSKEDNIVYRYDW